MARELSEALREVAAACGGKIVGMKRIQKLTYFAHVVERIDGVGFRLGRYGPFSPEVERFLYCDADLHGFDVRVEGGVTVVEVQGRIQDEPASPIALLAPMDLDELELLATVHYIASEVDTDDPLEISKVAAVLKLEVDVNPRCAELALEELARCGIYPVRLDRPTKGEAYGAARGEAAGA